ncbi:MAG TPA: ribonuclease HII [Actinomycetota bacterium]|nr:ribonuclease HII [Actinomycetota bacterium]
MVALAPGRLEARLTQGGFQVVAGADEVGRGALAGPLVAAAVILPPEAEIDGLRDSKLCTRLQRERIAAQIHEVALAVSIVKVRHDRIDRDGLHRCNMQALRRALKRLEVTPDFVLLDAFRMQRLSWPALAVKKADVVSKNVAAASIVAKVHRDRAMRRYHRRYKQYGFATNVGYGTSEHWAALKRFGPCEIHRRSFFGVVGFPDEDGVIRPHAARELGVEQQASDTPVPVASSTEPAVEEETE